MTQKLMAEAEPAVRAFDQARHVGDHEAAIVAQADDAEVRRQRRERIIRDLRTRRRHARNECRLARVRKAHQPHVGEQFQFESKILDLASLARLHLPGRAIGRRGEPSVPQTSASAVRDEDALALFGEIGEQSVRLIRVTRFFVHERADGDGEIEIGRGVSGTIRAFAVSAALGRELGMEPVVDQGIGVWAGDDVDRSTMTAVAAARTTTRHELLAAERETAASAVARFDVNVYFVNKHKIGELVSWRLGESIHQPTNSPTHQLFDWLNADDSPVRAVVLELHAAGNLREDRVVFTEPRIESRAEPASALANDDRSAGHDVAIVGFDAEPLRVRIAAVS